MTTPNDKFKIIETAPEFTISPTGSYSSASLKIVYQFTSKNPTTGSTVISSGILGCNAPVQVTSGSGGGGSSWSGGGHNVIAPQPDY